MEHQHRKHDRFLQQQHPHMEQEDEGLMESLEQQMMDQELETERMRMEQERARGYEGSKRGRRRSYSGLETPYNSVARSGLGSSYSDHQKHHAGGRRPLAKGRQKEGEKDINRRLSLPFGSLEQEEGRMLRKSSIYPSLIRGTSGPAIRRGSLVDSVPALIPYASGSFRKETDASVYTATTCADTNTLSDNSRRSGSNASLMLDGSAYSSSFGDMNSTNHSNSNSTIGTSRGWFDADTASSMTGSSSGRHYQPRRPHRQQQYPRRQENYVPERGPRRPQERQHNYTSTSSERDFTRQRYYARSQMSNDMPLLYGSSSLGSNHGEGESYDDEDILMMDDLSMQDHSLTIGDLQRERAAATRSQHSSTTQRDGRPRSTTSKLSPCQERSSRSIPNLSPCHERSERSSRSMMETSPFAPARRSPPSSSHRRETMSKKHHGAVADRDRTRYGDVSSQSSLSDDAMATSMPCIGDRDLDWNSSDDFSPRSPNTYPFDRQTERCRRRRYGQSQEQQLHGQSLQPEGAVVYGKQIQTSSRRRRNSGSRRDEYRSIDNEAVAPEPTARQHNGDFRSSQGSYHSSDYGNTTSRSRRRSPHSSSDSGHSIDRLSGSIRSQRSCLPPRLDSDGSKSAGSSKSSSTNHRHHEESTRYLQQAPSSPPREVLSASTPSMCFQGSSIRPILPRQYSRDYGLASLYSQAPKSPLRELLSASSSTIYSHNPSLSPLSYGASRSRSIPSTASYSNQGMPTLYPQAPPTPPELQAFSERSLHESMRSQHSDTFPRHHNRDRERRRRRSTSSTHSYHSSTAETLYPQHPSSPPREEVPSSHSCHQSSGSTIYQQLPSSPPREVFPLSSSHHTDSFSLGSSLPQRHDSVGSSRSGSSATFQGEPLYSQPSRCRSPPTGGTSSSLSAAAQPPPETTADQPIQYIEIGPGERAVLRGPKATRAAIVNDFYVPKVCYGCYLDLFCIKDSLYFVCPVCKVVSPMVQRGSESDNVRQHGACTGFTFETLFEMQAEIMQDDSDSANHDGS